MNKRIFVIALLGAFGISAGYAGQKGNDNGPGSSSSDGEWPQNTVPLPPIVDERSDDGADIDYYEPILISASDEEAEIEDKISKLKYEFSKIKAEHTRLLQNYDRLYETYDNLEERISTLGQKEENLSENINTLKYEYSLLMDENRKLHEENFMLKGQNSDIQRLSWLLIKKSESLIRGVLPPNESDTLSFGLPNEKETMEQSSRTIYSNLNRILSLLEFKKNVIKRQVRSKNSEQE